MPSFGDDLYLGSARLTPGDPLPAPGATPQQGGFGVGPLGRIYVWDVVPAAPGTAVLAALQTLAAAGNLALTAGAGVTSVRNARGETVLQLDTPSTVNITAAAGATTRSYTVTGYDRYGQKMSELIPNVAASSTASGKKAFYQVLTIAVDGATTNNVSAGNTNAAGTNRILGSPIRFTDFGYIYPKWNNTLAADAGTPVVADATSPATTATGDVRGTYQPSSAVDGTKRLIVAILVPAIAAGPNANRIGGYGVDQNLGSQ
jgi:hypothetical protein